MEQNAKKVCHNGFVMVLTVHSPLKCPKVLNLLSIMQRLYIANNGQGVPRVQTAVMQEIAKDVSVNLEVN